jgi:hypothetical protein
MNMQFNINISIFITAIVAISCSASQQSIQEKNDWRLLSNSLSIQAHKDYLNKYPGGDYSQEAKTKLKQLEQDREVARNNFKIMSSFATNDEQIYVKITAIEIKGVYKGLDRFGMPWIDYKTEPKYDILKSSPKDGFSFIVVQYNFGSLIKSGLQIQKEDLILTDAFGKTYHGTFQETDFAIIKMVIEINGSAEPAIWSSDIKYIIIRHQDQINLILFEVPSKMISNLKLTFLDNEHLFQINHK